MHIAIEANIGAGKSTLLTALAREFPDLNVTLEPIDEWKDILPLFYADKKRWGFAFQMQVLLSFLDVDRFVGNCLSERSAHACRCVFGEILRRDGDITEAEWKIFESYFNTLSTRPYALIYLRTTPEVCYERVLRRGDQGITLDYLTQVHQEYEKMIDGYTRRTYTVDATQSPETVLEHVRQIVASLIH